MLPVNAVTLLLARDLTSSGSSSLPAMPFDLGIASAWKSYTVGHTEAAKNLHGLPMLASLYIGKRVTSTMQGSHCKSVK